MRPSGAQPEAPALAIAPATRSKASSISSVSAAWMLRPLLCSPTSSVSFCESLRHVGQSECLASKLAMPDASMRTW